MKMKVPKHSIKYFLLVKVSLLFCFRPKTGKTHQLRKVAKNLNIPIIGDDKYNYYSKYYNENVEIKCL